jgi:hypothetical protein
LGALIAASAFVCPQAQTPPGTGLGRFADIDFVVRDYSGNLVATDSNWFYLDLANNPISGNGAHPAIEFDGRNSSVRRPGPNVPGVAYVRTATTASISLQLYSERLRNMTGTFTPQAARLAVPNQAGGLDYIPLGINTTPQSVSLSQYGYCALNVQLSNLPNFVSLGRIQVKYNLPLTEAVTGATGNNGTGTGYESWEMMYRLDSSPVGLLAVPWVDFLDYTCRWAYGSAGSGMVKTNMTYGMHYSNRTPTHRLKYDPTQPWDYLKQNQITGQFMFMCYDFVSAMNSSEYVSLDCNGFGTVLSQAMASQGVASDTMGHYFYQDGTGYIDFVTNRLCRAGQDSTITSYDVPLNFTHHTMTCMEYARYDASSSYLYKLDGSIHKNPVAGWLMPDYFYNLPSVGLVAYPLLSPVWLTLVNRTCTVIK